VRERNVPFFFHLLQTKNLELVAVTRCTGLALPQASIDIFSTKIPTGVSEAQVPEASSLLSHLCCLREVDNKRSYTGPLITQ
jgi:hypothetical protein